MIWVAQKLVETKDADWRRMGVDITRVESDSGKAPLCRVVKLPRADGVRASLATRLSDLQQAIG